MKRLLISAAFAILASQACAQESSEKEQSLVDTKKTLVELCKSPRTSPAFGVCAFYLAGFTQGLVTAQINDGYKSKTLCLPPGITWGGVVEAFMLVAPTLKGGPLEDKAMSHDPGVAATAVLTAAFPCRN